MNYYNKLVKFYQTSKSDNIFEIWGNLSEYEKIQNLLYLKGKIFRLSDPFQGIEQNKLFKIKLLSENKVQLNVQNNIIDFNLSDINELLLKSKPLWANLKIKNGDATAPGLTVPYVICHITNDVGAWGAGFVLALSKLWEAPEKVYRASWRQQSLGDVSIVPVSKGIHVANLMAQHNIWNKGTIPPIRYEALTVCLGKVYDFLAQNKIDMVVMPRIGCGLAGGKWEKIEPIIHTTLIGVNVFVYDL